MEPENDELLIEISSSRASFSGSMLVFEGVVVEGFDSPSACLFTYHGMFGDVCSATMMVNNPSIRPAIFFDGVVALG